MMNEKKNINEFYTCASCGCVIKDGDGVNIGADVYCTDCVTTCDECGEIVPRDEVITVNDWNYCDECATECLFYCENCGEYHSNDDAVEVRTGYREYSMWCNDCAEADAICCADCGCYVLSDYAYYIGSCDYVCEDCADRYSYCEVCETYVHYTQYDSDADMCRECARENAPILNYHGGHKNKKHGECKRQWRGIWRGFGYELEIDRNNRDTVSERNLVERLTEIAGDALVFERDGSLQYGFEIITQPHTEEAMRALNWRDILHACHEYGYTSHDNGNCGLHVHISREIFGADEVEQNNNIAKLIYFYDVNYDDIVKISRREYRDAVHWADRYDIDTRKQAVDIVANGASRYHAVNITNRATVEIRIMRGTLNFDTFNACTDFVQTIAKNARKIRWRDIDDRVKWLRGIDKNTREYIQKRNAFAEVL
jgi:hypothetical protein